MAGVVAEGTGQGYRQIFAVLYSAFAVEAHLNHVGERCVPAWDIIERRLSVTEKLEVVAHHLGITIDNSRRPFQTLRDLFKFRNQLAHGRTHTYNVESEYDGESPSEDSCRNPEWLEKYRTSDAVKASSTTPQRSSKPSTSPPGSR
jgi:hypothetical protein